jgi:hypothetical protein
MEDRTNANEQGKASKRDERKRERERERERENERERHVVAAADANMAAEWYTSLKV